MSELDEMITITEEKWLPRSERQPLTAYRVKAKNREGKFIVGTDATDARNRFALEAFPPGYTVVGIQELKKSDSHDLEKSKE